jgi:DNA-binding response OmpR family regulator
MKTVLIIEDDVSMRKILRMTLEKAGFGVLEAADGRQGVAAFEGTHVDLVITDLIMPEQGGVETILRIRELAEHVPIIALSGAGEGRRQSPLEDAMIVGANVRLAKPVPFDDLLATVKVLMAGDDDEAQRADRDGQS